MVKCLSLFYKYSAIICLRKQIKITMYWMLTICSELIYGILFFTENFMQFYNFTILKSDYLPKVKKHEISRVVYCNSKVLLSTIPGLLSLGFVNLRKVHNTFRTEI